MISTGPPSLALATSDAAPEVVGETEVAVGGVSPEPPRVKSNVAPTDTATTTSRTRAPNTHFKPLPRLGGPGGCCGAEGGRPNGGPCKGRGGGCGGRQLSGGGKLMRALPCHAYPFPYPQEPQTLYAGCYRVSLIAFAAVGRRTNDDLPCCWLLPNYDNVWGCVHRGLPASECLDPTHCTKLCCCEMSWPPSVETDLCMRPAAAVTASGCDACTSEIVAPTAVTVAHPSDSL